MAGKKIPFEQSRFDKERPGMKEGSPKEEAMDRRQKAAASARGMQFMKKGGRARGRK
jgi:hypothetical protein